MRILMINMVCGIKSTGKICTDIAEKLSEQGHTVKIAYGREYVPEKYQKYAVKIGQYVGVKFHALHSRIFDNTGEGSYIATKIFLKWVEEFNPDIIHLHNIHGYYINMTLLFEYIKKNNKKVVWTLHDCWSFTGHCAYFTMSECMKWKTGCSQCPNKHDYPSSYLLDCSEKNWKKKRNLFTGVKDLCIVTPSKWLANCVQDSYLKEYPVKVINNGIDTNVFKPTSGDFRKRYNIENKVMILGVASEWGKRKGLEDFIELSQYISKDYVIVLVGLRKNVIDRLPNNIIGINRTDSPKELAEIYTAADVFFNPTYEDNYPTVNLEALCCGTYVVTYNTGGSPEALGNNGLVIEKKDYKALLECVGRKHVSKDCFEFSRENFCQKHEELYNTFFIKE